MAYVVRTERSSKPRSGVSLGGIGCGWFEMRQDGCFYNWNIFNNRPSAQGSHFPLNSRNVLFFLLRIQEPGGEPLLRLLQIEESHDVAGIESHEFHYMFPWLGGMDRITYRATVPFIELDYEERDMPLEVKLTAWSPFIPRNAKDSSLPIAYFDFEITSKHDRPLDVSIIGSMRNCVGYDVKEKAWASRIFSGDNFQAFEHSCTRMNPVHASHGSMALASLDPASRYYLGWGHIHPYYERLLGEKELPNIDDTAARNAVDASDPIPWAKHNCFSSIGRAIQLEPGARFEHRFLMAWDFPNRYACPLGERNLFLGYLEAEIAKANSAGASVAHVEGHYYSNYFESAEQVMRYAIANRDRLEEETRAFHDAFYDSSLPLEVLDQVNSQLNTFRTSSWFTREGDFGILEGLSPERSFAGLATTDVAMYGGVSTAALFPELDRSMIRAHIRFQNENGSICHSILQNFREKDPREANGVRLDMPSQFAYMALRIGLSANDRDFLAEVWPSVRKALAYVLRDRDANGDLLPDMKGIMCSYDNFPMHGVAPYVATQWLAAISAALEAARLLGDAEAEGIYSRVLQEGSQTLEGACWNGQYYRLFADGERLDEGCLSDQIIGEWACRLLGVPSFLQADRVRLALSQILQRNFYPSQGLRNCQWPDDGFLHPVDDSCWVDQANTCWTGVELAFASFLIYEGMVEDGLKLIQKIDARHRRWGIYWDHQEFGGHYYRSMSAWAIVPACLGFSACAGTLAFSPKIDRHSLRLIFTTPEAYARYEEGVSGISITVLSGVLEAEKLIIHLPPNAPDFWRALWQGYHIEVTKSDDAITVPFSKELRLKAGEAFRLEPTFASPRHLNNQPINTESSHALVS